MINSIGMLSCLHDTHAALLALKRTITLLMFVVQDITPSDQYFAEVTRYLDVRTNY